MVKLCKNREKYNKLSIFLKIQMKEINNGCYKHVMTSEGRVLHCIMSSTNNCKLACMQRRTDTHKCTLTDMGTESRYWSLRALGFVKQLAFLDMVRVSSRLEVMLCTQPHQRLPAHSPVMTTGIVRKRQNPHVASARKCKDLWHSYFQLQLLDQCVLYVHFLSEGHRALCHGLVVAIKHG